MLLPRLIPVLLLRNQELVKTVGFRHANYIGDPVNAIRIFNEKEVDEIIVLDIDASKGGREPDYRFVEQLASECFMPMAYGGGITSVAQARTLFSCGIEKVCINAALLDRPGLVAELAGVFGSQAVVGSVDVKKNWQGKRKVFDHRTGRLLDRDLVAFLAELEALGAGEVLMNCVHHEGAMNGMDLAAITQCAAALRIPVIACGGVASLADAALAVQAGASAVAAGSFFVYYGPHRAVLITYPTRAAMEATLSRRGSAR